MVKNFLIAFVCYLFLIYPSLSQRKENREVPDFNGISFRISGTLYLTQGNTNSVALEGDRDDLEEVETRVRGDILTITKRGHERWFSWRNERVDVYVTVKNLRMVSVSGAGSIVGESLFKTGDLDVDVSGSGRIDIRVEAEDLDISISGSGSVEMEGSGKRADLSISGSGKLRADRLEADSYEVDISGSGSASINVREAIYADISGSGSVRYRGNPDKVRADVSGSGSVRKF